MKKSIKLLAVGIAALGIATSIASCGNNNCVDPGGGDKETTLSGKATNGGKILNIRTWNDEFINRFRHYYSGYKQTNSDGTDTLYDGTIVKWTKVANDGNAYQTALDEALKNQDSVAADEKVDMFLSEADYILKYSATDYTLDVEKDIGLTSDDTADQYQYTKTIATSGDALKGVSWQATPGLYAYRRDIAKEVWGNDDPDFVQSKLSSWSNFDTAAAAVKDKGYKILSGYDDAYRVYSNNMSSPWVTNGKVSIDPAIKSWVDKTKTYTDKGYSGKSILWDGQWGSDQGPKGNVLGFFYSTWGINFTLAGNSLADSEAPAALGNGLYGQYGVCEGPASWYWGGTWMHACKGTDNQKQILDIMKDLTCTRTIDESITRIEQDYTNNIPAMHAIASDKSYGSSFLGGQNHIALFEKSAAKIDMKNMTAYDQGCNEKFQNAMHDYFAGTVTYEKALENFKTSLSALYSNLEYNF